MFSIFIILLSKVLFITDLENWSDFKYNVLSLLQIKNLYLNFIRLTQKFNDKT